MTVKISELKKGMQFLFNHEVYRVKQKYSKWKKYDDPYLLTTSGQIFYNEGLEVQLLTKKEKEK